LVIVVEESRGSEFEEKCYALLAKGLVFTGSFFHIFIVIMFVNYGHYFL